MSTSILGRVFYNQFSEIMCPSHNSKKRNLSLHALAVGQWEVGWTWNRCFSKRSVLKWGSSQSFCWYWTSLLDLNCHLLCRYADCSKGRLSPFLVQCWGWGMGGGQGATLLSTGCLACRLTSKPSGSHRVLSGSREPELCKISLPSVAFLVEGKFLYHPYLVQYIMVLCYCQIFQTSTSPSPTHSLTLQDQGKPLCRKI